MNRKKLIFEIIFKKCDSVYILYYNIYILGNKNKEKIKYYKIK